MTAKLAHGDTVTLRYASKRTVNAVVDDITMEFPVIARAGKSDYLLHDDGSFQKIKVAADGGSILSVSFKLGTWEVARSLIDYRADRIRGKLAAARVEAERLVLDLVPDGVPDDVRELRAAIAEAQGALARVTAVRS